MAAESEILDVPGKLQGDSGFNWKNRLSAGFGLRRASAPDGKAMLASNNDGVSSLTGTALTSEPAAVKRSSTMPNPPTTTKPETKLPKAGARLKTAKANLSSGFPYNNALFNLHVSPDSWSEFSNEVVKATKLSLAEKTLVWGASIGVGLGTGFLSSSYLGVLGVAPAMIAGKVIYDKRLTQKVKDGLKSDEVGGLDSILRKWNEEVFADRGFCVILEIPQEADKQEKDREAQDKKDEKENKKAEAKERALLKAADKQQKEELKKAEKEQKKEQKKAEKAEKKKMKEVAAANKLIEKEEVTQADLEEKQIVLDDKSESENDEESTIPKIIEPSGESSNTRSLRDAPKANEKKSKTKHEKKFKNRFQMVLLPLSSLKEQDQSKMSFIQSYIPAQVGAGEREDYYAPEEDHVEWYPVADTNQQENTQQVLQETPPSTGPQELQYDEDIAPNMLLQVTPFQTPNLSGDDSPDEPKTRIVNEIYASPVTHRFYGQDDRVSQSSFFPTPRIGMSNANLTQPSATMSTWTISQGELPLVKVETASPPQQPYETPLLELPEHQHRDPIELPPENLDTLAHPNGVVYNKAHQLIQPLPPPLSQIQPPSEPELESKTNAISERAKEKRSWKSIISFGGQSKASAAGHNTGKEESAVTVTVTGLGVDIAT
jgi:hypothetical protein